MPSSFSKSRGTYAALAAGTVVTAYAGTKAYKSYFQRTPSEVIDLNNQSVEIDPVEHIRRGIQYTDVDINSYYKTIYPNVQTLGDVFYHGYSVSNNGPCLTDVDLSNKVSPLHWISYGTALERIRYIGSHIWTQAKLTPMQSKVAILSINRLEYIFAEHACYMYGFTVIGLYTTYDAATILSLLEKTETEVLIVDSLNRIDSIKNELLRMTQLKEILVMDEITCNENEKLQSIPSVLKTMQQAEVRPIPKINPDSIATFILTSGTTGKKNPNSKSYF
jgi:long-chain acyl-CoA synthetase